MLTNAEARTAYKNTISVNTIGLSMTCIEYRTYRDCDIHFDIDGAIVRGVFYGHFLEGAIEHPKYKSLRKHSTNELSLLYYLKPYGFQCKSCTESPLYGLELDMYDADSQIAIEYDGVHYHKKEDHDRRKLELCKKEGIRLFRIRESGLDIRVQDDFSIPKGKTFAQDTNKTFAMLFDTLRKCNEKFAKLQEPNVIADRLNIVKFIGDIQTGRQYVGDVRTMKNGQEAMITKYIDGKNIFVKFLPDGPEVFCPDMSHFYSGDVRNPEYDKGAYLSDRNMEQLKRRWIGKFIHVKSINTDAEIIEIRKEKRKKRGDGTGITLFDIQMVTRNGFPHTNYRLLILHQIMF